MRVALAGLLLISLSGCLQGPFGLPGVLFEMAIGAGEAAAGSPRTNALTGPTCSWPNGTTTYVEYRISAEACRARKGEPGIKS